MRVAREILQQKLPDNLIRDRCAERRVNFRKEVVSLQRESAKRCQERPVRRRVTLGRDIDDREFTEQPGILQRKLHGDLAAHRVTEYVGRPQAGLLDELAQVFSHYLIVHHRTMRRLPVIAQIDGEHPEMPRQKFTHRSPVVRRAEKAVDDN